LACGTDRERDQTLRPAADLTDLLYRVEQHRRALVADHLLRRELNFSQWVALRMLRQRGPCSMTELAQSAAIDRTSLTRTIDTMIRRSLVARWTPPQDRRTVLVDVTDEGKRLADKVADEVEVLEGQLLLDLSIGDLDQMAYGLKKILARLPGPGRPVSVVERASALARRRSRSA
jgi:DNA-binding MarR family transcriptional regulator